MSSARTLLASSTTQRRRASWQTAMLPVQSLWPPLKNICQEASLNVTKPKPAESLIARYEGRKRKTPQQNKTSGQKVVPAHAPPDWTILLDVTCLDRFEQSSVEPLHVARCRLLHRRMPTLTLGLSRSRKGQSMQQDRAPGDFCRKTCMPSPSRRERSRLRDVINDPMPATAAEVRSTPAGNRVPAAYSHTGPHR
ncbi:MAG: hypothetical protein RIR33_3379 [Pseudomonadota bacterium]|jgi:hypothetical protein